MLTRHYSPLKAKPTGAKNVPPQQESRRKEGGQGRRGRPASLSGGALKYSLPLFVWGMINDVEHALHTQNFISTEPFFPFRGEGHNLWASLVRQQGKSMD